jgi:CheY-like chemotaxis protein
VPFILTKDGDSMSATALKKEIPRGVSKGKTVLLVDDNYDFYKMMKSSIEAAREGDLAVHVDYAPDGFTALHMAKKNQYDAIICDIQMPYLDGIKLVAEFTKKHYDIPFILISGHLEDKITSEAFQVGAYNVLKKPFKVEDLLEKVERAIALQKSEKIGDISEQERAHIYNMLKMYYYDVEKIILLIQHFQIPVSYVQDEIKKKSQIGKCIFDDLQNLKYYTRSEHGNVK